MDIADLLNLSISSPTSQVSMRYTNNQNDSNLTINLIFLQPTSDEFDNHIIYSEWRLSLNHIPLTVKISILEEHIQFRKRTPVKNSDEEAKFISNIINLVKSLDSNHIDSAGDLGNII